MGEIHLHLVHPNHHDHDLFLVLLSSPVHIVPSEVL